MSQMYNLRESAGSEDNLRAENQGDVASVHLSGEPTPQWSVSAMDEPAPVER